MTRSPAVDLMNKVVAHMRVKERPARLVTLALHRVPASAVGENTQTDLAARVRVLKSGNYHHAWPDELATSISGLCVAKRVFLLDQAIDWEPAFVVGRDAFAKAVRNTPRFFSEDGFIVLDPLLSRGMSVVFNADSTIAYCPLGAAVGPPGTTGMY